MTHPDGCRCRLCWLAANVPAYAGGFAGQTLARPAAGAYPPPPDSQKPPRVGEDACVHLGDVERGEAGPCLERRHWCNFFAELVTVARCSKAARSCERCPEYQRKGA